MAEKLTDIPAGKSKSKKVKTKAQAIDAPVVEKNREVAKSKAVTGRPSTFTQELADRICSQLAMGDSLRTVCKGEDMPALATVFNWFRNYPSFLEQYTRAKQESADAMAEDILDIADHSAQDIITKSSENGTEYEVVNNEVIQRSRLRVETRKWLMAKMKPKKYGDKLDLTSDGEQLPSPILAFVNQNDTSHDINTGETRKEVLENTAKHSAQPKLDIMGDINAI